MPRKHSRQTMKKIPKLKMKKYSPKKYAKAKPRRVGPVVAEEERQRALAMKRQRIKKK